MTEPLINEYDVYYHKYAAAMSDHEAAGILQEETPETGSEEPSGPVQLDGYITEFDTKVALTPVELVPLGTHK